MKDYTNYDYQALVDRMTDALSNTSGWGDAYKSSMGQTLIELMADVTDQLHYMLERRTMEGFINTARLRSSIFARANELGYRPHRARGNSGYLRLEIIDSQGNPRPVAGEVVIEAMTPVKFDGRSFYVVEDVKIPQGSSYVDLRVKEGALNSKSFTFGVDEIVFVDYENIEDEIFIVTNNGEQYKDVRRQADVNKRALSFLFSDDAYYDLKYGTEGMRVEFGDGNFGKKPSGVIEVVYSEVSTDLSDIISLGNKFEFESPLRDFQFQDVVYEYRMENITPVRGSVEAESTDSIRRNASAYHRSNGRAVTNEDYVFWTLQAGIGDIVDAKSFGEDEFESLVYNLNNVYITYATETGVPLSTYERQMFADYFDKIKTSQVHVVMNPANNVLLRLILDVVKNPEAPISNSQAYGMIRNFVVDYMKLRGNSIGGFVHMSDIINSLYGITYDKNGVSYKLVDYAKVSSDVVIPFDHPAKTNNAFVEISTLYTPTAGDKFVLNLDNLICSVDVTATDTYEDILLKMRDVIREVTQLNVTVQLSGIALDAFGNPISVEINPRIGYHLLIGADTPYISYEQVVGPAVIGSAAVTAALSSDAFEATQYYYSSPAGRRPMIPLREGTEVIFTAPTDTDVDVYIRTDARVDSTEYFYQTITAGTPFSFISNTEHVIIFDYKNNSVEDVTALIKYPYYSGVKYGLNIKATDNFGKFDIRTTSGDLAEFTTVDYKLQLPVKDYVDSKSYVAILRGTVRITDVEGNVFLSDDGEGRFVDLLGNLYPSGEIDYKTGGITLPKVLPPTMPIGKYLIMYHQDDFQNVAVGSSDIIKLIDPPATPSSTEPSLTELRVR